MGVRECELIFDGVSSNDIGVTVEGYPGSVFPEKDVETETIPGRNGDIVYDYGTYKNYAQSYMIHWRYVGNDALIATWLNKFGYKRLEDSFHPDHYRMAIFSGPSDVDNRMQVLKRTEIQFNCKPQMFRRDGEIEIEVENEQVIENTGEKALPLIKITGSGSGSITIGSNTVIISNIPESGIIIDSELQDAYSPDKLTNMNSLIALSNYQFPVLNHGENTILISGGIESVNITPRWWDLL